MVQRRVACVALDLECMRVANLLTFLAVYHAIVIRPSINRT